MSGSIELDPKTGVNPHLGMCPRCRKDNGEVILIGRRKQVMKCNNCDAVIYGHRQYEPCPRCKLKGGFTLIRKIEDRERIPSNLCEKCEAEEMEHMEIVKAGGVYFKCKDCNCSGVIKADAPFSQAVRKALKIGAPKPCGVEFSKNDCPQCGPDKQGVADD